MEVGSLFSVEARPSLIGLQPGAAAVAVASRRLRPQVTRDMAGACAAAARAAQHAVAGADAACNGSRLRQLQRLNVMC